MIAENITLRILVLSNNMIGDKEAVAIAEGLKQNQFLRMNQTAIIPTTLILNLTSSHPLLWRGLGRGLLLQQRAQKQSLATPLFALIQTMNAFHI